MKAPYVKARTHSGICHCSATHADVDWEKHKKQKQVMEGQERRAKDEWDMVRKSKIQEHGEKIKHSIAKRSEVYLQYNIFEHLQ